MKKELRFHPYDGQNVELRRESNRLLLTASLSKVHTMLNFQYRAAAAIASAQIGGGHDVDRYCGDCVADLRMTLFRPALPQLANSNNDALSPERKDEQQECLFVGDGEVNEHILLESPHQGIVGISQ